MKWQLRLGKNLKGLRKLQKKGKKIPMLENEPVLTASEHYYLKIFQDLNARRSVAGGSEALSMQDFYFYFEIWDIDKGEDQQDIFDIVGHVDNVFMDWNTTSTTT